MGANIDLCLSSLLELGDTATKKTGGIDLRVDAYVDAAGVRLRERKKIAANSGQRTRRLRADVLITLGILPG